MFNLPKSNLIGLFLNTLCFYLLLNFNGIIFSQSPIEGPGMQWFKEQWYEGTSGLQVQDESGEDWYYDFQFYDDDDVDTDPDGFIGAGFSGVPNETFTEAECIDCGELDDYNCKIFETQEYRHGCNHPKLAEMNLKGEIEWYYLYGPENSSGFLRSVIQTGDRYVAIGRLAFEGGYVPYNYQVNSTGSTLSICPDDNIYNLLYLVQTDEEGEVLEERVYGMFANPEEYDSEGYEIIRDYDEGGYAIVGYTDIDTSRVDGPAGNLTRAWVIKIDNDLEIEWQRTFASKLPEPITPVPWSAGYCIIEMGDYYYVGCTQATENDFDGSLIHIYEIDKSTGATVTDFLINSDNDALTETPLSGEPGAHNRPFQFVIDYGELLVAAGVRRNYWWGDTEVRGLAKVYRIDVTATPHWDMTGIDITEGQTFDLKTGITNTSDGGFAVCTTVHEEDMFAEEEEPYIIEYFDGEFCTFTYDNHSHDDSINTRYWNANAYIAKFNSSDVMEWESPIQLKLQE